MIQTWLAKNVTRIIVALAVLALVASIFAVRSCQSAQTAKTRERLATGQAGAALESGRDAVQTISNTTANETDTHAIVKDGTADIAKAPAGNSNDTADRASCRLRSYRNSGKCIALLGPVAK